MYTVLIFKAFAQSNFVLLIEAWTAYNLIWNPDDYDGIKDIRADIRNLWRPDILLFNRY